MVVVVAKRHPWTKTAASRRETKSWRGGNQRTASCDASAGCTCSFYTCRARIPLSYIYLNVSFEEREGEATERSKAILPGEKSKTERDVAKPPWNQVSPCPHHWVACISPDKFLPTIALATVSIIWIYIFPMGKSWLLAMELAEDLGLFCSC